MGLFSAQFGAWTVIITFSTFTKNNPKISLQIFTNQTANTSTARRNCSSPIIYSYFAIPSQGDVCRENGRVEDRDEFYINNSH